MNLRRALLTLSLLLPTSVAFAGPGKPATGADADAIDQACADDAKTAGCESEQVGTGLLKCLHAYKKGHAEWKPSPACHEAMKKAHHDHGEKHPGGQPPPANAP